MLQNMDKKLNKMIGKPSWATTIGCIAALCLTGTAIADESRLVSIGELNLEASIQGDGPQTIVFESGLGYDYAVWGDIADELSVSARVVSYSRAGNGQSDKSDQPRDS